MVIDTDTLSSGMPANRMRMSAIESIATPAMPTSPATRGWSLSWPRWVARSNATLSPCCPAASALR
jgi:hypothetical protein